MEMKTELLKVVEGKWDTANNLCELWRAQVCVCMHISSCDAVAVSKELVQADSQLAAVVHEAKLFCPNGLSIPVSMCPWQVQIRHELGRFCREGTG